MKYALLSVYKKDGIVEFAKVLVEQGFTIISTGGTAKVLKDNNIHVIPIEEITGNPESFDGRIKTVSFQIEGGILFDRSKKEHQRQASELKIKPIDIVVCNLYPFEKKQTIENIDVGGPTMVRAAAKNFKHVLVVVDPNDYQVVEQKLKDGQVDEEFRKTLAAKAFAHLSFYDSQIAKYLKSELFPNEIILAGRKVTDLRYGENPHQQAALYVEPNSNSPFEQLEKHAGRDLSLTNASDINAGLESVRMFDEPCSVIIKHNTPCGIALGETIEQSLKRAIDADPESAFGGVVVLNKKMNMECAKLIAEFKSDRKGNMDIIAAPEIDKEALSFLPTIRKTMGIYTFGKLGKSKNLNLKWVDGGFILQTPDADIEESFKDWEVVTKKKLTSEELEQMHIAWKFISRVRSNSIIIMDKDFPMTRGIGSGQTSRYRSVQIALLQAGKYAKGGVLASDSFFPFDDSVILSARHGISAIVQQGGSINDKASIEAADKAGIAMVFTNRRAFWH